MEAILLDRLRSDLESADYRSGSIAALLGEAAEGARLRGVLAPARAVLAEREASKLALLAALFLLRSALTDAEINAALPHLGLQGAMQLGLIGQLESHDGDSTEYHALLSLNAVSLPDLSHTGSVRDWWLISDLDDALRGGPARTDHVMGVGGATRSLVALTPIGADATEPDNVDFPDFVVSALDLGTGCGVVALVLAGAGVARVVATDISERALMMAAANARLNEVDASIEFRQGNLFEPVAGERFDLIMSNPPFVITPRTNSGAERYEYRDAGLTGDDLIAAVVHQAPAYLDVGGTLLCLGNWETPWGGNGLDRVRGWIEGAETALRETSQQSTLAAWVIERDRLFPAQYAETWARDGGARQGDPEFDALVTEWLTDFASRKVVSIGLGSIRVQRLTKRKEVVEPIRLEQAAGAFGLTPGKVLAKTFAQGRMAEVMTDAELLGTAWVLHGGVAELREYRPGEESPRAISLSSERGIARQITADTLLAGAVGACDGDLTLGQISDALATLLEVDAAATGEALAAAVRELVWFGMLRRSEI